jgi:mitochondrial fission protein ELM1
MAGPAPTPVVWLLMGHKAGDNAQVLAVAEALGWPFEIKRLAYRPTELITNLMMDATLAGVDRRRSSTLGAPWPGLVITAGRRNDPVARWIQGRSMGGTRLVRIGRPWKTLERFDLIVTTPQYQLPQRPNILVNTLPPQRISETALREAAQRWAPRLTPLPRPRIALMVGGSSGAYTFDAVLAGTLASQANAMAAATGGSLLVTTSARTPPRSAQVLSEVIACPAHVYRWSPTATDNPYLAYLALADAVIVTGESVSMLSEACATRKPVYVFDLERGATHTCASPLSRRLWGMWQRLRIAPLVHRLGMRHGPTQIRRDIQAIHRQLEACGRAVPLDQPFPTGPPPPPLDDLERTVARVRALFPRAYAPEGPFTQPAAP